MSDLPVSSHAGDGGGSFGQQHTIAAQLVAMIVTDEGLLVHAGFQLQQIIVSGGSFVFDLGFNDYKEDTGFFHISIAKPSCAKQFHAAHLKVLQMPAVVQIPHGINFGVPDANFNCVFDNHLCDNMSGQRMLESTVENLKIDDRKVFNFLSLILDLPSSVFSR